MRTRVSSRYGSVLVRALLGAFAFVASVTAATAQTTVTLSQPDTQVVFATIRGGAYDDTNFSTILETRASDDSTYKRRALLKFDTQNTIPAGSTVTSAYLTVTVKDGNADASRAIGVYQVTTAWTETEVTWKQRRTSEYWGTVGGDLGSKLAQQTVGNTAGTKVTFDVTALVQKAVSGALGSSRYTRVALIDLDTSTPDSWRSYYTPRTSTTSYRPVLKVTYGSGSVASPSTSTSTLHVLHWNTHHGGVGTDGVWDPYRLIKKAASFKPDIVSLNEVERYTGWGNCDEPALIASLMKQYTGQTWYYKFITATGASTGNGNMVMSRFPIVSTHTKLLSHNRSAVDLTVSINGRTINVTSTHLDANSTSYRLDEIQELMSWEASNLAEQRIIAGDFNAGPTSTETSTMKQKYYDTWAVAYANGTAISYPDNPYGYTRNSRIDYIYQSHGATYLVLKSVQVFDVRDSNGIMPSDHRPLMSTFTVK